MDHYYGGIESKYTNMIDTGTAERKKKREKGKESRKKEERHKKVTQKRQQVRGESFAFK
jgi:hypothetical protein